MSAPETAPRPFRSPLGLLAGVIVALCAAAAFEPTAPTPVVATTWLATAGVLGLWLLWLWRAGRIGPAVVAVRQPHWVQACMQGIVYGWWAWNVPQVADQLWLIALQIPVAYAVDGLISWTRGRPWRVGFGPIPMIGSTNLFLWFVNDVFYWQIAMVFGAILGREFIVWQRGGRRRHVFNPSGFVLTVATIGLIIGGDHTLTWGEFIATSLYYAPNMYDVLFGVGLVVMFLFGTTPVTACAAVTCWLFDVIWHQVTGVWYFGDTSIPIAVFLGMNLLITDPATSPNGRVGKGVFGMLYGLAVFPLYEVLHWFRAPSFYDKLLQVPVLNLLSPAIDRLTSRVPARTGPRVDRVVWLAWIGLYLVMRPWLVAHPGAQPATWRAPCAAGDAHACFQLRQVLIKGCDLGDGAVCLEYAEAVGDPTQLGYDQRRSIELRARACDLGHAPACAAERRPEGPADRGDEGACSAGEGAACVRLANTRIRGSSPPDFARAAEALIIGCQAKSAVACADLGLMALRGDGIPQDSARAAALHQQACDLGLVVACARLAQMYEQGLGVAPDAARAQALYRQACAAGDAEACRRSAQ